jgi:hypothetical protein
MGKDTDFEDFSDKAFELGHGGGLCGACWRLMRAAQMELPKSAHGNDSQFWPSGWKPGRFSTAFPRMRKPRCLCSASMLDRVGLIRL